MAANIRVDYDGHPLNGTVRIGGGKHAFAHSLACAAMAERGRLTEVPDHLDARALRTALATVFGHVSYERARSALTFSDPVSSRCITLGSELTTQSRSLFCLLPALLRRADTVVMEAPPQGCRLGDRPSDWYLKVLAQFGVTFSAGERGTVLSWPVRRSADVTFPYPTMTGTVIALAAASVSEGRTVLRNASVEPSCAEQLACLRAMGGHVDGALPDVAIRGFRYGQVDWQIAPDRIHAVTYLTAGLLTRGKVTVSGSAPLRIPRFAEFLREAGVQVDDSGDRIAVAFPRTGVLRPVSLEAGSEPRFSSDWVAFASLLLAIWGSGRNTISDDVFLKRFQYLKNLEPHGLAGVRLRRTTRGGRPTVLAEIDPSGTHIKGGDLGHCADIRGSAALVLAGLVADGPCMVVDDFHVRRGYTDLPGDLTALGGGHLKVRRVEARS